eukprot:13871102-Alexandrium_andersonii.AAC.1
MSASLVGSEMCIRDRVEETSGLKRSGMVGFDPPAFRGFLEHSVHTYTVSYTHLTLPTICSV